VTDQNDQLQQELNQYLEPDAQGQVTVQSSETEVDPSQVPPEVVQQIKSILPPGAEIDWTQVSDNPTFARQVTPDPTTFPSSAAPSPEADSVTLGNADIARAQQVMRPPWYASWVGVVVILLLPILLTVAGYIGGDTNLQAWGVGGIVFLFVCGFPFLGLPWLALFMNYRDRVQGIRSSIDSQRGWSVTGPLVQTGARTIAVPGFNLSLVHRARIPAWARSSSCTVLFAGPPRRAQYMVRGTVISIAGPGGRVAYPPGGAVPAMLRAPAIVASILFSLGFTAACNAQSQTYADAAARMQLINAASECTKANKPGDDCTRWVSGTVTRSEGYAIIGASPQPVNSSCTVLLRWPGGQQQGDIRVDGVDCTKQLLTGDPIPAQIEVIRNFAVQVRVGDTVYQTDRWPSVGDTVFTLASIYRVATILWLAWPFIHLAAAVIYRFAARRPADMTLPPAPAMGAGT
jgi:hypothetical protein